MVKFILLLCNNYPYGGGRCTPCRAMNCPTGLGHLQLWFGASPWWQKDPCLVAALVVSTWQVLGKTAHMPFCLMRAAAVHFLTTCKAMWPLRFMLTHYLQRWSPRPELGGSGLRIYPEPPTTALGPWAHPFTFLHLEFPYLENERITADVSWMYHILPTVYNYNENSNIENKSFSDPAVLHILKYVCL